MDGRDKRKLDEVHECATGTLLEGVVSCKGGGGGYDDDLDEDAAAPNKKFAKAEHVDDIDATGGGTRTNIELVEEVENYNVMREVQSSSSNDKKIGGSSILVTRPPSTFLLGGGGGASTISKSKPAIRFEFGDNVECNTEYGWAIGRVVHKPYFEPRAGYNVRLRDCFDGEGKVVFFPVDERTADTTIRPSMYGGSSTRYFDTYVLPYSTFLSNQKSSADGSISYSSWLSWEEGLDEGYMSEGCGFVSKPYHFDQYFLSSSSSSSSSSSLSRAAKPPKERKAHFTYKKQTKETLSSAIASNTSYTYVDCGAFSRIPIEIILIIFQYLPLNGLYTKVCKVSKAFFSLARKMSVLNYKVDLRFLTSRGKSSSILLDGLSKINEHNLIQEVSVGRHKFGKLTIKKLLDLVPNIQAIQFNGAKKVNINHLRDLYRNEAPALSSFSWLWCFELEEAEVIAFISNRGLTLKKFEVCHFYDFDDSFSQFRSRLVPSDNLLNAFAKNCPELVQLSIMGKVQFSEEAITNFIAKCPKLEKVEFTIKGCIYLRTNQFKLPHAACQMLKASIPSVNLSGYE